MNNFVKKFMQPHAERYIFGATSEAYELVRLFSERGLAIKAIVDNFYSESSFGGVPCIKLVEVVKGSLVLSAVTNSRPIDVQKMIVKQGLEVCDYFTFYRESELDCPKIEFWENANEHYSNNINKYSMVRSMFDNGESQHTFDSIVGFRTNYDLSYMEGFKFDIVNMYFESWLPSFSKDATFFDLGAFDGSDSIRFLQKNTNGNCYLFEPIPEQAEKLSQTFVNNLAVEVVHAAVGNEIGQIRFSLEGTSSKVVDENSLGVDVPIVTLDSFARLKGVVPDFIKMDVEGYEMEVLKGARELIKEHSPSLAVSVYHRVEHLIDVPLFLKELNPSYKFYLKHYTQGYSETVLFAVPS